MDEKDLKIQALLEKIGSLCARHENELADSRVRLTLLNQEKESLEAQLLQAQSPAEPTPETD
jgi:hypothetical protein